MEVVVMFRVLSVGVLSARIKGELVQEIEDAIRVGAALVFATEDAKNRARAKLKAGKPACWTYGFSELHIEPVPGELALNWGVSVRGLVEKKNHGHG